MSEPLFDFYTAAKIEKNGLYEALPLREHTREAYITIPAKSYEKGKEVGR